MKRAPQKLYKFCPIDANSLRGILHADVFHSPPVRFNDPLDCNPSIEIDLPSHKLIDLLDKLMRDRGSSPADIQSEINRIAYFATDIDNSDDGERYEREYQYHLAQEIMRLLRLELGTKGVLSLSEQWDDPLLWSHYGSQHQGMCIEFDTSGTKLDRLRPVDYYSPRSLRAHDILRWKCDGDESARLRIEHVYFYSKAPQWAYEREWRDISDRPGVNASNFNVSAIHFGMRSDRVWKWMLTKTLHLDRQILLYDVYADEHTFSLHRTEVDRDELEQRRIAQSALRIFGSFEEPDFSTLSTGEAAVLGHTKRALRGD